MIYGLTSQLFSISIAGKHTVHQSAGRCFLHCAGSQEWCIVLGHRNGVVVSPMLRTFALPIQSTVENVAVCMGIQLRHT